ncbi:39S ribosomal protein L22, mitochondrial [Teratosphaeriaceae sp. CCFEE 6253]|nr:39S ribosomal protein L22, mitochondrial [Teratosphaeriaceae sp. CCFEE 6253]
MANSTAALFCQNLPFRPRIQHQQQRTALFGRGRKQPDETPTPAAPSNPVLEQYQQQHGADQPEQQQQQQRPRPGDLSTSSIFEDDRRAQSMAEQYDAAEGDGAEVKKKQAATPRDPTHVLSTLDPDPGSRERWERKKVIQAIRKGGRLTKPQMIKRTEREHTLRSHNMKTSVKKLGMLARQIAGKTIDDAITQMRFSKKRVAIEVLKQLEYARDEAVVMRGMGLGGVAAEAGIGGEAGTAQTSASGVAVPEASTPVQIQLKDGKRHTITNPSNIYIDQAWVGRGPFGKLPDYRARGRTFIMYTPWTSLSVVLKEEQTRIRLHDEREQKRRKALIENVWTHLPDRPVQWQRQWYTF